MEGIEHKMKYATCSLCNEPKLFCSLSSTNPRKTRESTSFKRAPCAARGRVGGPAAAEAHGGGAALPPEPAEGHVPGAASAPVLRQPPAIPGEAAAPAAAAAAAQVGAGVDPAAAAAAVAPAPRGVRGLGPPPPAVAPLLPVTTTGVAAAA